MGRDGCGVEKARWDHNSAQRRIGDGYHESMHMVYSLNTFEFSSTWSLTYLRPTIPQERWDDIRVVELKWAFPGHWLPSKDPVKTIYVSAGRQQWIDTCKAIMRMKNLQVFTLSLTGNWFSEPVEKIPIFLEPLRDLKLRQRWNVQLPEQPYYVNEISDLNATMRKRGIDCSIQIACAELTAPPAEYSFPVSPDRDNPRWSALSGQSKPVILRNATLFDGDLFQESVDIVFERGVIRKIATTSDASDIEGATVQDLDGLVVTPGLVDMHSHHLVGSWPSFRATNDINEIHPSSGPLTPFVRALDSIKAYDPATTVIASGGVTSSLILPGSANIMGGEAVIVKNLLRAGDHGEENVEELLLEHGIPKNRRRRYMKMACGENPRRVYGHTRMGNAWILREHLARAKELRNNQDAWCLSAAAARERGDSAAISSLVAPGPDGHRGLPEELELDSTVGMLRGQVGVNVHCYEPEDMEDMILHSEEFGFRIQAFHHSLSSWKVPELIKASGQNITIATFADFGLYKVEGYESNLQAGKILHEHGVPVAYKSDHVGEDTNAKYLLSQAATAHSFGLPELAALRSVTSVPAKSLGVHHRIGYVRPGYDADLVIWDSHPLSVGATPLQVPMEKPAIRPEPPKEVDQLCSRIQNSQNVLITGIRKSYLTVPQEKASSGQGLVVAINSGKITCLGGYDECVSATSQSSNVISLQNGHILPGLTAFSTTLGLQEIPSEKSTSDGSASSKVDPLDPENVVYAKYGIHPEGRAFDRARIGGVTRAVTAPIPDGFLSGVSVGIKTGLNKTILDGGVFQDDVALHFVVGQESKGSEQTPTVSTAVARLRKILFENKGKDSIYGKAANGTIPIVVHSQNKHDILQLVKLKKDHGAVKIVIYGASEAPAVAKQLAAADIPLLFTAAHGAPDTWEKKDALAGPPLTESPVKVLSEANVTFGLAFPPESDWHLHSLGIEASWAAKDSGLSSESAVNLVSRNIEHILDIPVDEKSRDFVIYEGNPLQHGASVVLSVDGDDGSITTCWPLSQ
ncbi:conserved hypothetical protein [Paecilomyces variotii No. 5]|uniref:Uncharacterized protein n=1 Tax=Byssochlamys spectabilis (strain No. 5 / NBRC 109023) TaxID=1356009 RepID=V5F920_BYSSN|nr:conserved hypothetical protein [Paecilomyces variotii No. 5]